MLDSELLWKAFTAFDTEGKGYITEKDLRRVEPWLGLGLGLGLRLGLG